MNQPFLIAEIIAIYDMRTGSLLLLRLARYS